MTIERKLSPAQSARCRDAREAARELARVGGYEGVTMQAVADQAGVTRMTLYRYFASKDHLLAALVSDWGRELAADIHLSRPSRGNAGKRVAAAFKHIIDAACEEPRLTAAMVTALLSTDPSAARNKAELSEVIGGYLDAALGPDLAAAPAQAQEVISHVFFSVLINLSAGTLDRDGAIATLGAAAGLCFGAK